MSLWGAVVKAWFMHSCTLAGFVPLALSIVPESRFNLDGQRTVDLPEDHTIPQTA